MGSIPASTVNDRKPAPAVGAVTRGTTAPQRLRRVDTWLAARFADQLRLTDDPLVIDLGFGSSPVTTVELRSRLVAAAGPRVRVVGLEIDPDRVAAARPAADPPSLRFLRGGFELAGLRPVLVRAMNVLRQYDEGAGPGAWRMMSSALAPGGAVVEGTCDESGRIATWVTLDRSGPRSLTLAADLTTLATPATLAERLPKALIHRNVPGEGVHALLDDLVAAWSATAGYGVFGPVQRWRQVVATLRRAGWPVVGGPAQTGRGELTVRWSAVAVTTRS
jgi:hypothetical protein